jgi:protein phosphatase
MPQMPMSAFEDDDEEVPVQAPEAVPIIYDNDAALDEPTRISALILVSAAGQTDLGQRRKKNEDSYLVLEDHNLFVVADGMGGHAGGEVASKIAVDTIGAAFNQTQFKGERYPNVPRRGSDLALAIQMANEAIFERAKAEPELNGMGTTVVSARFSPNKQRLYVGHVGDSRCYRLRDQELRQVTTDHTMGSLGVTGPLAERLERAVGIAPAVKVDIIIARPLPNDIYLLCSDGLSKMVSDAAMRDILIAEKDLNKAAAALIATANAKGGRDNITVILIQVKSPAGMML